MSRGRETIDLVGVRFGRLVVLRKYEKDKTGKQWLWEVRCDCGCVWGSFETRANAILWLSSKRGDKAKEDCARSN